MRSLAFFLFLVLSAETVSENTTMTRFFFTANRQSEIEPCGCQTGQIGGLNRLSKALKLARSNVRSTYFFDVGDAFFSTNTIPIERAAQDKARAEVIAKSYSKMKLTAYLPGRRDFVLGWKEFRRLATLSNTPFVVSNVVTTTQTKMFRKSLLLGEGKERVGVIGLLEPNLFSDVRGLALRDPKKVLPEVVGDLKKNGAKTIVLLSYMGLSRDREIAKLGSVDLIFGSQSLDVLTIPQRVGNTIILQPDLEGKQLGILDFDLAKKKAIAHQLLELDENYEAKNEVHKLMQGYLKKVRDLAFSFKKPKEEKPEGHPYVAHPFQCRTCHQKQYDFWAKTHHASAYLVLYSKNQHFNPECISCHSLGFGDPLGFKMIARPLKLNNGPKLAKGEVFVEKLMERVFEKDRSPLDSRKQPKRYKKLQKKYTDLVHTFEKGGIIEKLYIGVQCEHCHGNRYGHPDPLYKTTKKVQETSCRQCHVGQHDPTFNFAKDVALIACPKIDR